jgi:hypothetical protein
MRPGGLHPRLLIGLTATPHKPSTLVHSGRPFAGQGDKASVLFRQQDHQPVVVLTHPLTRSSFWTTNEQTPDRLARDFVAEVGVERHHHESCMESVLNQVLVEGFRQPDCGGEYGRVTPPIEERAHSVVHVLVDEEP